MNHDARVLGTGSVGFVVTVHFDYDLARRCLTSVRKAYPSSPITVISDGDADPRWPQLAAEFQTHFLTGDHCFDIHSGRRFTERLLRESMALGVSHVLRIDTDTRVHRQLLRLPTGCVFGTRQRTGGLVGVQGGCTGICTEVLPALLTPEYLEALDDYRVWAVTPLLRRRAEVMGLISWDWSVAYLCHRAGVPVVRHREIASCWLKAPRNVDSRFAVTHPHKLHEEVDR